MSLRRWAPAEMDDAEPFLTDARGDLNPGPGRTGERAIRWLRQRCGACRGWWAVTTRSDFLSSSASRRNTWWIMWTLLTTVSTLYDLVSGRGHTTWDVSIVVMSILLGQLPPGRLLSDVAIVLFWTACQVWLCLFCDDPDYLDSLIELGTMAAMGCHSSSLMLFVALNTPLAALLGFTGQAVVLLVLGVVLAAGHAFCEHQAALLFDRVQRGHVATRHLLDTAGDGFCNIDTSSGVIDSASPKLQHTFSGWPALQGQRFQDLLAPADVARFQTLCSAAKAGDELGPVLVTCQLNRGVMDLDAEAGSQASFDAKLVPHKSCEGEFSICIQVMGEMRLQQPAGAAAESAAVPAAYTTTAAEAAAAVVAEPHTPRTEAQLDEDSEAGTVALTYSVSQTRSSESRGRGMHHGGRGWQTTEMATQTEATQGRPPRPPGGTELGRPFAPRALPQRRAAAKGRSAHPNSSQRILPQFRQTPRDTAQIALVEAMAHINACGSGCCKWHVAWAAIRQHASQACREACQPTYAPYSDFQCTRCGALNTYDGNEDQSDSGSDKCQHQLCEVCGHTSGPRECSSPSSPAAAGSSSA